MTKAQFTSHEIDLQSTVIGVGKVAGEKTRNVSKARLKTYAVDLRIHSPVALGYFGMEGVDALPALVRLAKTKGLDVITVTDFYSSESVDRIKAAAEGSDLIIIPGVDIRARTPECDDIQLTCLFSEQTTSADVAAFLAAISVPAQTTKQSGYVVQLELGKILSVLDAHHGTCFPSRMDKTPVRMGAIPRLVDQYGFRAFDLAYGESSRFFQARWPKEKFNLFSFSNANALAQVGSRSARVKLDQPSFESLRLLVRRAQG